MKEKIKHQLASTPPPLLLSTKLKTLKYLLSFTDVRHPQPLKRLSLAAKQVGRVNSSPSEESPLYAPFNIAPSSPAPFLLPLHCNAR